MLRLAATNTWRAYSSAAFPKPQAQLKRNVGTGGTENSPNNPPAFSFYRRHAAGQGGYQIGLRMPFVSADPYLLYGKHYSHLARADRFAQCGPPSYKLIGLNMLGFANEEGFGPYVVEQVDHFLFHQPEETGLKAGPRSKRPLETEAICFVR